MKLVYFLFVIIIIVNHVACSSDDNSEKITIDGDKVVIAASTGEVSHYLKEYNLSGIKTVIIKGDMNLYDFKALSEIQNLENLDISGVSLMGGDFEENSCTFDSKGENSYYLWKWVFRSLGKRVILRYPNLKSLVLPASNIVADAEVLAHYTKLEHVILSPNLSSLGIKAFYECPLKIIYSKAAVPPRVGFEAFYNLSPDCILYVPKGSKDAYEEAEGWKFFKNIQEI